MMEICVTGRLSEDGVSPLAKAVERRAKVSHAVYKMCHFVFVSLAHTVKGVGMPTNSGQHIGNSPYVDDPKFLLPEA